MRRRCDTGRVKFRNVGSRRQLDSYRIVRTLVGVIKAQAFAHLSGLHANSGIVAGVVAGGAAENLDSDNPFFEDIAMALEGIFDNITEEILAALAGSELMRSQHTVEFLADLFFGWILKRLVL
jgi:hypothetical protein